MFGVSSCLLEGRTETGQCSHQFPFSFAPKTTGSKDFTCAAEKRKEKISDKGPVLVGYWERKIFLPAPVFKKKVQDCRTDCLLRLF